jgi:hypothetical protein
VSWEFDAGLEGWANATAEEMRAEIYPRGGDLHGAIRKAEPFIDSPRMWIEANDRHYLIIRMMVYSWVSHAKFVVRRGDSSIAAHLPQEAGEYFNDETFPQHLDFDDSLHTVTFEIKADGRYNTYYVPLWHSFNGTIAQLRLYPATNIMPDEKPSILGHTFSIDWIKIAKAPTIRRVTGCIDQFYDASPAPVSTMTLGNDPVSSITTTLHVNNDFHKFYHTNFFPMDEKWYATTYNCVRTGGQRITLVGKNFDVSNAEVFVGGVPCTSVVHTIPEVEVQCTLPPGVEAKADVTLVNGRLTGLHDTVRHLSYAVPPDPPPGLSATNIATSSVDLTWDAPPNFWVAVTVTGYRIVWKEAGDSYFKHIVDLGNVTTTTIIGLSRATTYEFRIASVTEDQVFSDVWLMQDLYGRRSPFAGSLIGDYSPPLQGVTTLRIDFKFGYFDGNSTFNHSASDLPWSLGPSGNIGSEGHYGLNLVGDANLQNCNTSHSCCDGYDPTVGVGSCGAVCSAIGTWDPTYINGESNRNVTSNVGPRGVQDTISYSTHGRSLTADSEYGIYIGRASGTRQIPSNKCGSALRLTAAYPRLTGAAWYPRKMDVREGFETSFTFQLSNPSTKCKNMDDVFTFCRSRGSDGFAFVIQNQHHQALGASGSELGYGGIQNSVAIEFDTWFNYEQLDLYENHLSVQTRGWRERNSANHSYSIASSSRISDLTDGMHKVKIEYSPVFDEQSLFDGTLQASAFTSYFFENADFPNGGLPDWGIGVGTLKVYFDDMKTPIITCPISMEVAQHSTTALTYVQLQHDSHIQ